MRYDINFIKCYLLPILVNDRDVEPIVIEKGNQFVSCKFGNVQLLDNLNFLGGAISLDSFLKVYTTWETKGFFRYERFNHPHKLNVKEFPPYEAFHNKLRNCNLPEKEYLEHEKLMGSGLTTESALVKLRLSEVPPTGAENYSNWQKVWEQEKMQSFKDFFPLVQWERSCPKIGGYAKNGRVLSQQRHWYAEAWLYST